MSAANSPVDKRGHPFVSVIIPVYNDADRLIKCLDALEEQTYPRESYEVVVVDNASEESVTPVVASFEQARDVYEARPGSYAARNRGIECAQGEVIAFTDADCIPHGSWLERGVERLMQNASCGLVGGRVVFFFSVPEKPSPAELFDSTHFLNQKKYVRRGHYAATANAFTWKRVLDEVGVFDGTLRSGGDAELGKRVHQYGYDVLYADKARVYHPARHSYRALRRKKARVLEGTTRFKKERGYPFAELITDVTKDIGHHAKFAVRTALEKKYGWKETATLLIAFPIQGIYTATKRAQMWSGSPE